MDFLESPSENYIYAEELAMKYSHGTASQIFQDVMYVFQDLLDDSRLSELTDEEKKKLRQRFISLVQGNFSYFLKQLENDKL